MKIAPYSGSPPEEAPLNSSIILRFLGIAVTENWEKKSRLGVSWFLNSTSENETAKEGDEDRRRI
jgi:hypothetical protein